jgi:tetratricopeptide (TPR) repeat protein
MVRINGPAAVAAVFFAAGVGVYLGFQRGPETVGPKPVAVGKTMTQLLPDENGRPQPWKITKREVPRDKLADLVLPKPALRTALGNAPTDSARALDTEALETWRRGDLRGALDLFEAAVRQYPDDPQSRSDYGRLLTLMTDYERALPHLEKAAELEPRDPQVWLDLETFYERNELFERAAYAKQRADQLAGGRNAIRDDNGFWILEGTTFP